jgi:hypothetical protein
MYTVYKEKSLNGGVQKEYRFDNGYGASVIQHNYSYGNEQGLWELAVIKWDDEWYDLVYDTDITEDVIGNLTLDEVQEILVRIESLKGVEE